MPPRPTLLTWVEQLQSRGRYSFIRAEAESDTGRSFVAALHGAAHQQPMVFQVLTSRPTREMRAGRVAIRFTVSRLVQRMPVTEMQTETGTMRVATPETTAFDLVRYPAAAGHLSNVATVLAELAERMDGEALAATAPLVRLPDVQRLGFLLDAVGQQEPAASLGGWLRGQRLRVVSLVPGEPSSVDVDEQWRVVANAALEPDL